MTLNSGRVVGTSGNDYTTVEDDEAVDVDVDVPLAPVPPQQRGHLGEDFRIGGGGQQPGEIRMDCVPAKRDLTGGPRTACVDGLPAVELNSRGQAAEFYPPQVGQAVARLLSEDDPWLAAMRQVRARCTVAPQLPTSSAHVYNVNVRFTCTFVLSSTQHVIVRIPCWRQWRSQLAASRYGGETHANIGRRRRAACWSVRHAPQEQAAQSPATSRAGHIRGPSVAPSIVLCRA